MPLYCGTWTRIGQAENHTVLLPIRCRSWACPTCGPANRRRLLRRLRSSNVSTLITLTANPSSSSCPDEAFSLLSQAIPHLVKRIKRQFPSAPFEYVLIWERTKQGWPHAHILARSCYLPQRWVSRQWAELVGARIVDIRTVRSVGGAVHYVSKYLSKDPYAPYGMKRWRTSRAFFPEPGGLLGQSRPTNATWHTRYLHWTDLLHEYPAILFTHEIRWGGGVVCTPRPPPHLAAQDGHLPPPSLTSGSAPRPQRGLGAAGQGGNTQRKTN